MAGLISRRETTLRHALLAALAPCVWACGPEASPNPSESLGSAEQALAVEPDATSSVPISIAAVTPTPAQPACANPLVINVNSFADDTSDCTPAVLPSVMPSCTPSASTSLREAILMANSNTDKVTDCTRIVLPAGTYLLTLDSSDPSYALEDPFGDDLDVWASKPLIIVGAGAATTIVRANASFPGVQGPPPRAHRLLQEYLGSQPTYIDGVTFEGGYDPQGGGIFLGGFGFQGVPKLTLVNSVVQNNRALQGAGIFIEYDFEGLVLHNTIVRNNKADSYLPNDFGEGSYIDRVGAAIYNSGTSPLRIADSQITGNTAAAVADGGTAYGGGLYSDYYAGPTLIEYSTFDGNVARGGPQGNGSSAGDAYGGGIYEQPQNNFYIVSSTISNNSAIGGTDNPAARARLNGNGYGGGIYVGNGGFADGPASLANFINVTVASNQAVATALNGSAAGGGVYGQWGFSAFYLTAANNQATWGNDFQTSADAGGGVYLPGVNGGAYYLWRSALGGNLANGQPSDCEGSLNTNEGGANVVGAGSCSFDPGANLSTDPGLSKLLRSNGGPLKTVAPSCPFPPFSHAPLVDPTAVPNSTPAIDNNVLPALPVVDARGKQRAGVQGTLVDGDLFDAVTAHLDSGAFEAQPPTLSPGASSPAAVAGGPFVALAPGATFNDPDLGTETYPMLGAAFYVSVVSGGEAGDQLGVATGNGITVNGSNVLINGVQLATIQDDGAVPVPNLFVQLNGVNRSTVTNARGLLRKLAYRYTGSTPATKNRTVRIVMCDGGGGISLGKSVKLSLCAPTAATDTTCDGIDDDCSGAADEDYVAQPTSCGIGACAATGTTSCSGGEVSDSCSAGTPISQNDATCDGVDDNCSGEADEDYVSVPTKCGVGVCAATGNSSCSGGQISSNCTPGAPTAATDTTCNGIDEDCSGKADEDYVSKATSCGIGACAATGSTSCSGGEVSDSCDPGSPLAATDTTCDGVDDDCSGSADEDYVSKATSCGVGACKASGSTSCSGGEVSDSCAPGSPLAASDTTCDGVDDDCSGAADEDYVALPTTCGIGACAATGSTRCAGGEISDSCSPGEPLATEDTTCDGVDDDCDGNADEDYVSVDVSCGVGACTSTGTISCSDGGVVNNCEIGLPLAADDTTCDGIDDDCDGSSDEEYASVTTNCGVGYCAATGTTSCVEGETVDSCLVGPALTADDTTCDGVDDDCDGSNDEDYVSVDTTCGEATCSATGSTSCVDGAVSDSCATDGADDDADGLVNCADECPTEAADTLNGCPEETGAGGGSGGGGADPVAGAGGSEEEPVVAGAGGEGAEPVAGSGGQPALGGAGGEGGEEEGIERVVHRNDAGCNCRAATPSSDSRWLVSLGVLALGLSARRRRRR